MCLARPLLPLLLLAVIASPASAADMELATTSRPTELAAGSGVLLDSAYGAKAGDYRLMARKGECISTAEPINGGLQCDQEFGGAGAQRCAIVRRDPRPTFVSIPAP